jgi:hypothetical protein
MILIFIDETRDSKFKDYFGLCCANINSYFYKQIKTEFHSIIKKSDWDTEEEFKGSYIFSLSQGCKNVSIEKRINIASDIIDLNTSTTGKSARINFHYASTKIKQGKTEKEVYLDLLPALLNKAITLPKGKTQGKDIISINCDYRSDITKEEIRKVVDPIIKKKGYVLLEDIVCPKSCFDTVGILYADIIGYLIARVDNISNDAELFTKIPKEHLTTNGKVKKLMSSINLIKKVKNFKSYKTKIEK